MSGNNHSGESVDAVVKRVEVGLDILQNGGECKCGKPIKVLVLTIDEELLKLCSECYTKYSKINWSKISEVWFG